MSDDLISRQAAIEEIEPYTDDIYNSTAIEIKEILQRLPSVQPKRKTGRWLINSDGYYPYCSICKNEPQGRIMTNYCPECGAYMKGESNDEATSN